MTAAPTAIFPRASGLETNNSWTKKPRVVNSPPPMSPASYVRKCFVLIGLLCALLCAFPAFIFAQTNGLLGGDVSFSGGLNTDQTLPAAAFGATGGFVLWQDPISDPFGLGVSLRRLNAALAPEGSPIRVNQTIPLDQSRPKVAMFADGGALSAWQSGRSGFQNVFARVIAADGTFPANEILVNNPAVRLSHTYLTNWTLIRNNKARVIKQKVKESVLVRQEFNANPSVAVLGDGSAVISWSSSRKYQTNTYGLREVLSTKEIWQNGGLVDILVLTNRTRIPLIIKIAGMQDVYAQRVSAAGVKIGGEFRVNEFTEFNQRDAALSPLAGGGFVAVWVSELQRANNASDIYARVFQADGSAGAEFCVSSGATRPCGAPAVAGTPGGGFTVTWVQHALQRTNGMDIFARAFDATGVAAGEAFEVNTFTYGDQFSPSIASLGAQQLLVWSSMGQDGSWEGVFAQALNGATKIGDEFRVNEARALSQKHPQVVSDGAGRALILWSGYSAGGSGFDVNGRTYVAP